MSTTTSPQPLTTYLLSLHPPSFRLATQSPFLRSAGTGTLPPRTLSAWLSQDLHYAKSYIRFVALLLSKIRLPSPPSHSDPTTTDQPGKTSIKHGLEWRLTSLLINALSNIHREILLFESTAHTYGLDLQTPWDGGVCDGDGDSRASFCVNPITRAYVDLFAGAAGPASSLLEGLVVLWATEKCYLEAWRYALSRSTFTSTGTGTGSSTGHRDDAKSQGEGETSGGNEYSNDADGGALRGVLIPNWTSKEFGQFVDEIGGLVDEVGREGGVMRDGQERGRCEEVWRQVLWLEERFWPLV
ncbi:hypothetical protein MMC16_004862 [Acarospora aff. strigata]|nr:hypothetical protein [Acarospora aff. strigata]